MTADCIIKQVEAGRLPEDFLCVMTPTLANQKDPVAAELLILICKRELWRRWGFKSMEDYIAQAGVPEAIMRSVALNLMIDELDQPYMRMDRSKEAQNAVVRLCGDGPFDMSNEVFSARYLRARELLNGCRSAFRD